MYIENEELFKHHLANGINFFLGAGFSVLAESELGKLPCGDGLKNELCAEFLNKRTSSLQLAQLCKQIQATKKKLLNEFLIKRFNVKSFNPKYHSLKRINISNFFTTNIDDLIHKIYSDSDSHYVQDMMVNGPSFADKSGINYIALHGCILYPHHSFDFTPTEIASSYSRDRDKWAVFTDLISQIPTLYWGYRLEDSGTLEVFSKFSEGNTRKAESWIQLRDKDEELIDYYKSLGMQYLIADTEELLDYFQSFVCAGAKIKKAAGPKKLKFPEYMIPNLSSVPVRTKDEFYCGSDPTWYDIFTDVPVKTSHILSLKNAILANENTIVMGPPASGKTTLMMQVANDFAASEECLFITSITEKKARLLCRECIKNKVNPYIFIDNAADFNDAIAIIVNANIAKRLIIADRDYFIDLVGHKFSPLKFKDYIIAEITEDDIAKIQEAIPAHLVKKAFILETEEDGTVNYPTIFDLIRVTVFNNDIFSRFSNIIKTLYNQDRPIYELITLAAYLYHCRIPTSLDVVNSYLRKYNFSLDKIHAAMVAPNGITTEYNFPSIAQLFITTRSRVLASAILYNTPRHELQALLNVVHFEISPTRINRYDIFKKYAFDAQIAKKAFPDYMEGLKFYEECFSNDNSFYIKQQCALYLSSLGEHEIAFQYIDEARVLSHNRNHSIRNSFAVIQFNANINKKIDDSVKKTLGESMAILKDCYKQDDRKRMHAKSFAKQSLQYADKFNNSQESIEYIDIAIPWIDGQIVDRPNDRELKTLKRKLASSKKHRRSKYIK